MPSDNVLLYEERFMNVTAFVPLQKGLLSYTNIFMQIIFQKTITALTDVSYKDMGSQDLHTKEAAGCKKITCVHYFQWFFHHFLTENINNPLN
jgi:hypothetical protein